MILGRLSVAFGHLGLVMLLCKTNTMQWLMARLAAIGQTALSNYILHSVLCCIIFTGYGFRLFDTMQRYQVYYVVAAIWVVNLTVSPIWLKHYRFGPMEWAWRSLTYWKRQPFRRRTESASTTECTASVWLQSPLSWTESPDGNWHSELSERPD